MAVWLLFSLQDRDLKANDVAFNAAISACSLELAASKLHRGEKRGQWQMAFILLKKMSSSVTPDVITYSAVISACQERRVDSA